MKAHLFIFSLSLGIIRSSLSSAQNIVNLEKRHGFRDAKLGMLLSEFSLKPLHKYGEYKNISRYRRPSDLKKLGDLQIQDITYSFFRRKLQKIEILADFSDKNEFVKTLQEEYGSGIETPTSWRLWKSQNVGLVISSTNELINGKGGLLITIWERTLIQQELAEQEAELTQNEQELIRKRKADL